MATSMPGRARRDTMQGLPPAGLAGLGNRFVELFGRKLSRKAFATETAKLITAAVKVRAVVVLGYDRRRDRLSLLAEQGLHAEARAALGAGAECSWDIPMRGLRNRRISVIEAAHQNPFVPRPLIELSPVGLCIASVPLYYDPEPVGVVLLFAVGSRAFPDTHLQTLSLALRACARGLRDTSSPPPRPSRPEWPEVASDGAPAQPVEAAPSESLVAAPPPTPAEGVQAQPPATELAARIQRLEEALRHAHDEVERNAKTVRTLTASNTAVGRERDGLAQQVAELERNRDVEIAELRAQRSALEERLLAVDSERARHQRLGEGRHAAATETIRRLENERDGLTERVNRSESTAVELRAQLTAERTERERLQAQVEMLGGEVRGGQETLQRTHTRLTQERAAIEADRDAWKEQASVLRTQLAERTETLTNLDRELRSATVGRDAAASQLQAARAEIDRLATLTETLGERATELEAQRAGAVAEHATLQRTLEEERAHRQEAEENLRADLLAARQDSERVGLEAESLRSEVVEGTRTLADRDEQMNALREELGVAREAALGGEQASAGLRAELAMLAARLEHQGAEHQQLLEERATLRTALTDLRQQTAQAAVAHAAAVGQLQAESAELRRQIETLTADRAALATRLERSAEEGRTLTVRLADAQRRSGELSEALRQRDATADTLAAEREELLTQAASLSGQLQAAEEALERTRGALVRERETIEAERNGWAEQLSVAREELALRAERLTALEHDLHATVAARDAAVSEVQAAREELDRVAGVSDELRQTVTRLDTERAAELTEIANLRTALDDERAGRAETVRVLRADLAAARAEAERLALGVAARQEEGAEQARALTERDQRLATLRAEIETLRQHSADRGVLAQQATELGGKVVELEQALAAARGEAERVERQRLAVTERFEAARRREVEAAATAGQERSALQDALQQASDERDRFATDNAALQREVDALRKTLAELQTALDDARTERARAIEHGQQSAGQLTGAQQQLSTLAASLREREGALDAAKAEIAGLADQLSAARQEIESGRAALASVQAAQAEEHAASEADRDAWEQQAAAARTELERLAALDQEHRRAVEALEGERTTLTAQLAAMQEERGTAARTADDLRAELASAQAVVEELSANAETLRAALGDRDAQLAALRADATAAREAEHRQAEAHTVLSDEVTQLTARLEETAVECRQLRTARAAVERQLALVTATHGEEEQALAGGLQAAREQVAHLEEERAELTVALGEARQRISRMESAHAAATARADEERTRWDAQIETLTAAGSTLSRRLEEAESALQAQRDLTEAERQRTEQLTEHRARLEESLAEASSQYTTRATELTRTRADLEALSVRLQTAVANVEQLRDERAGLEGEIARLTAAHSEHERTLAEQVAHLEEERVQLQASLTAARERAGDEQAAQAAAYEQLEGRAAELATQLQTVSAAHESLSERVRLAEQLQAEQVERAEAECRRAAALGEQCAQLEHALVAAQARASGLEGQVTQAHTEIEALRQQSEDRGVLAHQASELESRVVELEQQLAAVRGAAATADRRRAVLNEELEAARSLTAQVEADAERQQAALRETIDRLVDEHHRWEAERSRDAADAETQRSLLADQQVSIEQLRTERARALEESQEATRRLGELQRQMDALQTHVQQRDAALETATAERKRLAGQVAKLTGQLREEQDAVESLQGRAALERASLEADRDGWKTQAATARVAYEELAAQTEELKRTLTELEAARGAASTESAALRRALDDARASHRQTESGLRADLTTLQAEVERLSSEAVEQRGELAERDKQLALARHEQDAARQGEAEWSQTVGSLRAEMDALRVQLQQHTTANQELQEQHEAAQQALAEAISRRVEDEHALQAARERIAQLDRDQAAWRSALDEAREQAGQTDAAHATTVAKLEREAAQLRQQMAALAESRRALSERVERAERHGAAQVERAEDELQRATALAAQCSHLEQTLAASEARRTEVANDLAQVRTEIDALRQQSADRGALARQTTELGDRVADLEQQLAAQRGELVRAERQHAALTEEMETVRHQHEQAAAVAEREQTALRQALTRTTEERQQLAAEQARQVAEAQAQRAELAELRTTLEQLRMERDRAQEDGQDVAQRLADAHRRMGEQSGLLEQREAALKSARAERSDLEDAVRAAEARATELRAERDTLRHRVDEALARHEQGGAADKGGPEPRAAVPSPGSSPEHTAASDTGATPDSEPEQPAARYQGPLVIERSAPLGAVLEGAPEPLDAGDGDTRPARSMGPTGELVLLDEGSLRDDACAALNGAGFEVAAFPPTEAGVDEIARRKVRCVMLNLGSGPRAWHTLRTLRERVATRSVPILAYAMTKDSPAGFSFGRADFAVWPMDPARLIERLGRLRPKLRRLLALSADVDGMGRLREPLAQAKISTSIVLDGKQALDFAAMVDPEAAVLHLSPACPTVTRALIGLRASEATRDLPLLLLLDKASGTREAQFLAAATAQLLTKAAFQFVNLPEEIGRVIG